MFQNIRLHNDRYRQTSNISFLFNFTPFAQYWINLK